MSDTNQTALNDFTNKDIADYYDQTLNHYQRWWKLDLALAVHYGFWLKDTQTFSEALENTNRYLMKIADVQQNERVLDAGCGVGGSAFFLAREKEAKVTGISLSPKQIDYANQKSIALRLNDLVSFELKDYTNTNFNAETFDLVWAIESITSAPDKIKFVNEAVRILKPEGRLVIADYFKTKEGISDPSDHLEKWRKNWSMAPFLPMKEYIEIFEKGGLKIIEEHNVTDLIVKTSKRMYRSSLFGAFPSMLYNMFNDTSRFAKNHYKSGFYQYKALKKDLWNYRVLLFKKEP